MAVPGRAADGHDLRREILLHAKGRADRTDGARIRRDSWRRCPLTAERQHDAIGARREISRDPRVCVLALIRVQQPQLHGAHSARLGHGHPVFALLAFDRPAAALVVSQGVARVARDPHDDHSARRIRGAVEISSTLPVVALAAAAPVSPC